MSTIHGATELRQVTAKRQVYSPLEIYWDTFQQWCKRERLRTQLCQLTERELTDIGITRGEIDYIASQSGPATSARPGATPCLAQVTGPGVNRVRSL
jgi:uncharacterized protein YjiS (DUF1127 family)